MSPRFRGGEYAKRTIVRKYNVYGCDRFMARGNPSKCASFDRKGIIEESYVQAMIQNVLDNGNYIILLPLVAMPHARPEFGSKGSG